MELCAAQTTGMWQELTTVVLTTLLSIVVLFLLTKLMGNKQISQLSMFDYVVGITIGSIAAELAVDIETAVRPLIAMALYALIATAISILTNRSLKARRVLSGRPIVLMDGGEIYREHLSEARLDIEDLATLARTSGYFNLADIETALLEKNGTVSFLPRISARPATAVEQNLFPPQERLPVTLIEDGDVLVDNLVYLKKDGEWLRRELKSLGFGAPEEVFFAQGSPDGKLTAFAMENQKSPPPV